MSEILASSDVPVAAAAPVIPPVVATPAAPVEKPKTAVEQARQAADLATKALEGVESIRGELREFFMQMREGMAQGKPQDSVKAQVKGRMLSDDELAKLVERMSSEDAARLHELIAAKAENEKWAARGINPATHVIATEALKLMYDGKPIFTVPGQDYERAKLSPLDLELYGETHFTAPKLKK